MDATDFETLDVTIETERTQVADALRRIADRLDALAVEDVIEPLTSFGEQAREVEVFWSDLAEMLERARGQ